MSLTLKVGFDTTNVPEGVDLTDRFPKMERVSAHFVRLVDELLYQGGTVNGKAAANAVNTRIPNLNIVVRVVPLITETEEVNHESFSLDDGTIDIPIYIDLDEFDIIDEEEMAFGMHSKFIPVINSVGVALYYMRGNYNKSKDSKLLDSAVAIRNHIYKGKTLTKTLRSDVAEASIEYMERVRELFVEPENTTMFDSNRIIRRKKRQ